MKKWANELTIFKGGRTNGQKTREEMLNILGQKGKANQNGIEIPPHSSHSGSITQTTNAGNNARKKEPSYTVFGNVN
jgi:hypothetical protein